MSKSYPVAIVGESNYQRAIARMRKGDAVHLRHEPENPFDDRAIVVSDTRGGVVGYLPRDHWLKRAMLDEGAGVVANVREITGGGRKQHLGVVLSVELDVDPVVEPVPTHLSEKALPEKQGKWAALKWISIAVIGLVILDVLFRG